MNRNNFWNKLARLEDFLANEADDAITKKENVVRNMREVLRDLDPKKIVDIPDEVINRWDETYREAFGEVYTDDAKNHIRSPYQMIAPLSYIVPRALADELRAVLEEEKKKENENTNEKAGILEGDELEKAKAEWDANPDNMDEADEEETKDKDDEAIKEWWENLPTDDEYIYDGFEEDDDDEEEDEPAAESGESGFDYSDKWVNFVHKKYSNLPRITDNANKMVPCRKLLLPVRRQWEIRVRYIEEEEKINESDLPISIMGRLHSEEGTDNKYLTAVKCELHIGSIRFNPVESVLEFENGSMHNYAFCNGCELSYKSDRITPTDRNDTYQKTYMFINDVLKKWAFFNNTGVIFTDASEMSVRRASAKFARDLCTARLKTIRDAY